MTTEHADIETSPALGTTFRRICVLASAVLILFFSAVQVLQEYRTESSRLKERVDKIDKVVTPLLSRSLDPVQLDRVKIISDQLMLNESILAISVWDKYDQKIYENMTDVDDTLTYTMSFPIPSEQDERIHIGRYSFIMSKESLAANLAWTLLSAILLNAIKLGILAGVLAWFFNRHVIAPLHNLALTVASLPDDPTSNEPKAVIHPDHIYTGNEIERLREYLSSRELNFERLITDLRSYEEELRESEAHQRDLAMRLEFTMRANELGSYDIQIEKQEATFNDRWFEMLGLPPLDTKPSLDLWMSRVHEEDLPRLRNDWESHVAGITPSINNMHRVRHENGSWIWVLCTGQAPSRNNNNTATRIVGTQMDVSGLVNAREAALAASTSKSEFLANMSHEIRTPLNGVLGMTSLLKRTTLDATQTEFIKTIEISGKQLLSVISDILDLSKVEAGKMDLSPVKSSIREIVENVTRVVGPGATQKGLNLVSTISSTVPDYVYCDDTRLQQVLVNLASNAIKFTAQGQIYIDVSSRVSEKHPDRYEIEFHVRDEGIGIDPEHQKNLFKAFTQADSGVTRKYGGTGLGLAISKQIVGLMNGQIGVKSEVGRGSDFYFTIQVPSVVAMEVSPDDCVKFAGHTWRVLIAEDNKVNQKVLFKMFRSLGLSADVADNGVQAVHLCGQNQYDLILMDINMPEMDGIEASRRILSGAKNKKRRPPMIIAITATVHDEELKTLLHIGAHSVLEKPLTMAQIIHALETLQGDKAGKKPSSKAAS